MLINYVAWGARHRKICVIYYKSVLAPIIPELDDIMMQLGWSQSLKLRNFKVIFEPRFKTAVQLRKPDILAIRKFDNMAYVIDHTVVLDKGHLSRHAEDKE